MKTSLKYNLLQHLRRKQAEGGFTLIELLVVIIIIGILAAIALPSFLNQANRARESEAANYIGAANRGQQAYYLEFVTFATNTSQMDVGINEQTENYAYGSETDGASASGNGTFTVVGDGSYLLAAPRRDLKGFSGTAYVDTADNSTQATLCRELADQAKDTTIAVPTAVDACPTGQQKL